MDEILERALNAAQPSGATYADARVVDSRSQRIEVKKRAVRGARGDPSLSDMIASTDRGTFVTRPWYNRVVDARKTPLTGMTRGGTFRFTGVSPF